MKKRYKAQDRIAPEGHDRVRGFVVLRAAVETERSVQEIAAETKRSRSQVARILLEYGLAAYKQGFIKL